MCVTGATGTYLQICSTNKKATPGIAGLEEFGFFSGRTGNSSFTLQGVAMYFLQLVSRQAKTAVLVFVDLNSSGFISVPDLYFV